MAVETKKVKGTFEFTGVLIKKELIKNEDPNKNGKFEMTLYDKDLDSQVKVQLWEGDDGAYWDNQEKKTVRVSKDKVEATMREVLANATGRPFEITVVGNKGKKPYYVNNDLISDLLQIKGDKTVITVKGDVSFRHYNGRVFKDYKPSEIHIPSKKKHGFVVKVPTVISESTKEKFFFGDSVKKIPVLVNTKLQDGSFGYRPIQIALDKDQVLDGQVGAIAKAQNKNQVEIINDLLMKPVKDSMFSIKGYVVGLMIGRLKVGEITKKPTIEDLNPMELALAKIQGEDAVAKKLDSMDLITEYFDSMYFSMLDLNNHTLFEEISESELKLPNTNSEVETQTSNPMLDMLNNLTNTPSTTEVEEVEEIKPMSSTDELDKLVQEAEQSSVGVTDTEEEEEDNFPF